VVSFDKAKLNQAVDDAKDKAQADLINYKIKKINDIYIDSSKNVTGEQLLPLKEKRRAQIDAIRNDPQWSSRAIQMFDAEKGQEREFDFMAHNETQSNVVKTEQALADVEQARFGYVSDGNLAGVEEILNNAFDSGLIDKGLFNEKMNESRQQISENNFITSINTISDKQTLDMMQRAFQTGEKTGNYAMDTMLDHLTQDQKNSLNSKVNLRFTELGKEFAGINEVLNQANTSNALTPEMIRNSGLPEEEQRVRLSALKVKQSARSSKNLDSALLLVDQFITGKKYGWSFDMWGNEGKTNVKYQKLLTDLDKLGLNTTDYGIATQRIWDMMEADGIGDTVYGEDTDGSKLYKSPTAQRSLAFNKRWTEVNGDLDSQSRLNGYADKSIEFYKWTKSNKNATEEELNKHIDIILQKEIKNRNRRNVEMQALRNLGYTGDVINNPSVVESTLNITPVETGSNVIGSITLEADGLNLFDK